jgi:hypothetical protein
MHPALPALALLALLTTSARAADPAAAALEAAQKAARKLGAAIGTPGDLPLAIVADAERANLFSVAKESAILFVPDQKLSSEVLGAAGRGIVPLGQLWMRKLALAPDGKAAPAERLRPFTVGEGEKKVTVLLFAIGFAKGASGAPELVIYTQGQEPFHRAPLETINGERGAVPVQLSGRKGADGTGVLTLDVLGQYQAELTVVAAPEP